ncbi:hypothetical protein KFE25_010167 [Diacronema lutheri]|uniref:EF-hand domain-containing protein n=2 Tax=Diacronema lutheri TaxID=2081491 RepID=A0A8J6C9Q2_DIALT|nr:hypothetical protein KFE25_010167 [Diacronema lutheri]
MAARIAASPVLGAPVDNGGSMRFARAAPPATFSRRARVWHFLENDTRLMSFLTCVIAISTLTFILDTSVEDPVTRRVFFIIETVAVSLFTIEYVLKLIFAPNRLKFVRAKMSLIDLVAIGPFWVEVFIANVLQREASINLSWVRVLRLFRIFRIFKVSKLAYGFRIVMAAMRMSMTSFSVLVFFMLILVILSSSLMYMFEGTDPPHPMQPRPELFATIPDCMWWAVVTITTVGYGDAVPASPAGKVIATGTMCLGLLSIALPVTVLGSNFTKVMDMYEQELDMYDAADSDGNGNVSEDELRFFLFTKRQQGSVSDEFKQTALQLMRKYDEQNKGFLTRAEFNQLVRALHDSLERTRPPTTTELMHKLAAVEQQLAQFDARMARMEALLEGAFGGQRGPSTLSDGPAQADGME